MNTPPTSLTFSTDLRNYCQSRPGLPFLLGEWLASLEEDSFARLLALTQQALIDFRPEHTDVLFCVIQACQHEGRKMDGQDIAGAIEMLKTFSVAVGIESLIRLGWIEVARPFSLLQTATLKYSITELGWENEDSMREFLH
jgi:hypothetical protein